jgi:hypothetical protein
MRYGKEEKCGFEYWRDYVTYNQKIDTILRVLVVVFF